MLRVDRVGIGPLGVHGQKAEALVEAAVRHWAHGKTLPPWVDLKDLTLRPPGWFFRLAAVQAGRAVVRVEAKG